MYLNCHSYYSFKYGTFSEEQLLQWAVQCDISTLALTDINNTSGCLNFIRLAKKYNIRAVVGIDFRDTGHQVPQQQFVALAKNNNGFLEINQLLTSLLREKKSIPKEAPQFSDVIVIYPYDNIPERELRADEYIGVGAGQINQWRWKGRAYYMGKYVALQPLSYGASKEEFYLHKILRAIDQNILWSQLLPMKRTEYIVAPEEMKSLFHDFPRLLETANNILAECDVQFDFGDQTVPQNKSLFGATEQDDFKLILQLCEEGILYRYGHVKDQSKIRKRMQKELNIIEQKQYLSYFLINWDIIRYARSKNYFYVGRGSGANSIIAYLLKITDVDPLELDLYFERFINLYRRNPPDFDLDFSWKDRDDITRYIFEQYDYVSLLATYSTFQERASIRELGKVFGLPGEEITSLSRDHGRKDYDRIEKGIQKYAKMMHGFPSHLSIHAGGVLISEKPLESYSAMNFPPKGFPTTQFDMVIAEDVGLYKFDILSQRGLGKIKDCVDVIKINRPEEPEIDIHDIPRFKEDEKIKEILREGEAMGCFYVESPAMRMLLKKLRVDHYLGLVAASSIIRPGVAKSGMMREYILRYRNPERRNDAHPVLLEIMPDTFGVMVYQEDVIKVAHYFAGLTLAESDVLRRGMSGKYRSREEFQQVKAKFFSNCVEKGYTMELTGEIWRQIESFAGYAFSKGHSASYAVESYQSLYLKAHFPLEYTVAVINNWGGFYRPQFYFHEACRWGGKVHLPCINRSRYETTIYGQDIFIGFQHIKDLEYKVALRIVAEREQNGPFEGLEQFMKRVVLGKEQLKTIIRAGSFHSFPASKKALLWKALGWQGKLKPTVTLFEPEVKQFQLPDLYHSQIEELYDEIELLGYPVTGSYFQLVEDMPKTLITVKDLPKLLGKIIQIVGALVTVKNTATSKGDRMQFGTFLDADGNWIDTVHFPQVAAYYPFRGTGCYLITGKVVEEFGYFTVEVHYLKKLPMMNMDDQ